jgi:hypothetical protein
MDVNTLYHLQTAHSTPKELVGALSLHGLGSAKAQPWRSQSKRSQHEYEKSRRGDDRN